MPAYIYFTSVHLLSSGADPELDFGGSNLSFLCEKFLNTIVFYGKHYRLGRLCPRFQVPPLVVIMYERFFSISRLFQLWNNSLCKTVYLEIVYHRLVRSIFLGHGLFSLLKKPPQNGVIQFYKDSTDTVVEFYKESTELVLSIFSFLNQII